MNGSMASLPRQPSSTIIALTRFAAYFIVPVDKATVEKAVSPYELLSLPIDDASLFPNGFPAGKHPVLVQSSFGSDIRMSVLQLPDELLSGGISVPYTDRLGDEKTPFTFSVKQYVGGANGQDISGVVPGKQRAPCS